MYRVVWEIDIEDVESPTDAASHAYQSMRALGGIASVFTVTAPDGKRYEVDLFLGTCVQTSRQDNRRVPYPADLPIEDTWQPPYDE